MSTINASLRDVFRTTAVGDFDTSVASSLYGINHRMAPLPVPMNRDSHGLVLFSRPQLNLTDQNLRAVRQMNDLLTTEPVSIQMMVRKLLDPRLSNLKSPLVDDRCAFIPILTNHITNLTGFPDPYVNSYISKPGNYKESFGVVDDVISVYSSYDLNVTFRNMVGNPIEKIFHYWLIYASKVFEGMMLPYPDYLGSRIIDYNTRVWRLVLDRTKTYVTHIACCGAAYPKSTPLGAKSDYSIDEPIVMSNKSFSIPLQAFSAFYNDPILVHEFNKLVGIFNPDMQVDRNDQPIGDVVKIPSYELDWLNSKGYPRIDPETMELQWWLDTNVYNSEKENLQRTADAFSQIGTR